MAIEKNRKFIQSNIRDSSVCHPDTDVCMELISNGNNTHSFWMNNTVEIAGLEFHIDSNSIFNVVYTGDM